MEYRERILIVFIYYRQIFLEECRYIVKEKKRKADILLMKKISSDHPDDVDEDALDELMKSFLMNLIKTFQKRLKLSITSFLVLGKQVFISTFL